MTFQEWFYENSNMERGVVDEFDVVTSAFSNQMENFIAKAYEAGYAQGLKGKE